jgi:lipoyl(octanoyl) transferase
VIVKVLQTVEYLPCLKAMQQFTASRTESSEDEIWLVEHPPVFTLGLAGKPEHLLTPGDIPIVNTERGGQVTYHGLGQLVAYVMFDLRRLHLTVKGLVCLLEKAAIRYFASLGIDTTTKLNAPGVYIKLADQSPGAKIAALGLKVSRGCSFHGIALNIDMNLEPFSRINPCGYVGLEVTSVAQLTLQAPTLREASEGFTKALLTEMTCRN